MKTIWKFKLPLDNESAIEMPKGATVLCVQMQSNQPCLWAVVDEEAPREMRRFYVCFTGHALGNASIHTKYIGTFQIEGALGNLVIHVFEG